MSVECHTRRQPRVNTSEDGIYIADNGDLWESGATIVKTPCTGIDSNGNLTYGAKVTWPAPPEFSQVERLIYDGAHDRMFLGGGTPSRPTDGYAQVGPNVACYENWSGTRTLKWLVPVPFDNNQSINIDQRLLNVDWTFANRYLFLIYLCKDDLSFKLDTPGAVRIYNVKDGSFVGDMHADTNVSQQSGWVDVNWGANVIQRANGEYDILVEEDWKNKNLLYQWNPDGSFQSVGRSVPGSMHDLTLLRRSDLLHRLPASEAVVLDKGYDGLQRPDPKRPDPKRPASPVPPAAQSQAGAPADRGAEGLQRAPLEVPDHRGTQPGTDEPVPATRPGVQPAAEALRAGIPPRQGAPQRADAGRGGAGQPARGAETSEDLPDDLGRGRQTPRDGRPTATQQL